MKYSMKNLLKNECQTIKLRIALIGPFEKEKYTVKCLPKIKKYLNFLTDLSVIRRIRFRWIIVIDRCEKIHSTCSTKYPKHVACDCFSAVIFIRLCSLSVSAWIFVFCLRVSACISVCRLFVRYVLFHWYVFLLSFSLFSQWENCSKAVFNLLETLLLFLCYKKKNINWLSAKCV